MHTLCRFALLFSFTVAGLRAQTSPPPSAGADATIVNRFYVEALSHGAAYDNLRTLVDQCPGRLSGSPSLARAVGWAQRTLAALSPDRVTLQDVMVPHWERGPRESVRLLPSHGEATALAATALGGSVATPPGGLSAEIVQVHSLDELAALGHDRLAGKIVFFNRPMDSALYRTGEAYVGAGDQRNHGPAAAAKYGAVGAVVRSLTLAHDNIPHTGVTSFPPDTPKIPCAAISTLAADRLSVALTSDPHLRVELSIHSRWLPDAPSHNVIAEIRGTEFPGEVIVVGGHLDSWDIAPGAHDDGAGVVQSIEVLRLFRALGLKPRHTVRCVLFVNEENGTAGGKAYAAAAKAAGERHVFAIESDSGGFAPAGFRFESPAGSDVTTRAARWRPLFEPWGVWHFVAGDAGTDVEELIPLGVPAAELSPDSQRYFDTHHTTADSLDKVNPRELELGAATLASLIWLVDREGL